MGREKQKHKHLIIANGENILNGNVRVLFSLLIKEPLSLGLVLGGGAVHKENEL